MPLGELRELAVVLVGQVVANLAQLLVDDVEVVDEPLGSGRDRALFPDAAREDPIRVQEDPAVVGEARHDRPPRARFVRDPLGLGERFGMLLEPLDAEQLCNDRGLGITRRLRRPADREAIDGPLAETAAGRSGGGPQVRAAASCTARSRSMIG
jgi:hypothetical protein